MKPDFLTERWLGEIGGWQEMKAARRLAASGQVLNADWAPPVLSGRVRAGDTVYLAGLKIQSRMDVDNLCTCPASRRWGTICAHSLAVALHYLCPPDDSRPASQQTETAGGSSPTTAQKNVPRATPAWRSTAEGELAELHLIIPPNFTSALPRGKVMICFEVSTSAGRRPLDAARKSRSGLLRFDARDMAVLDWAERIAQASAPAMLMLDAAQFAELLPLLVDHPRVTLGRRQRVQVTAEPLPVDYAVRLRPDGQIEVRASTDLKGATVIGTRWVYQDHTFRPLEIPRECSAALQGPLCIPRAQVPWFLHQVWPLLEATGRLSADFALEDFEIHTQPPDFHLELRGGIARLEARLHVVYGDQRLLLGRHSEAWPWLADPVASRRYTLRDLQAEQAAVGHLLRAGFNPANDEGWMRLEGQDAVLDFFARVYPRLQRQWRVTLDERLSRSTERYLERVEPRFNVRSSGVQWFDLSVQYTTDTGRQLPPAEIQRLIRSGRSHARLKDGRFVLLDTEAVEELQEVLRDCDPQQHAGAYRVAAGQAGFIEATVREQGWNVQAAADWQNRVAGLRDPARLTCPPLGQLDAVLRPYQKRGVAWLRWLHANGFGGVLADEMGLGKTLQALALLLANKQESASTAPNLVVCPTSLVWNWVAEAQQFTPDLRVLALVGPERHQFFPRIAEHDLIVTSYALIRRDLEHYRGLTFDTVILDEAQHIKNRQTQNAQAVKVVPARHRIVLTGTPLENSVLDLWSIFDFLMPGYLGSARDFRERYELPVTRDRDQAVQARLARRVRPFILRRLKRDVAAELPPRVDQVAWCELTDSQRAVYTQLLQAGREEILQTVNAQGLARSRVVILNVLLRLRQVCCDLRLLDAETAAKGEATSAKLALFDELLDEVLDGGHRVLVFSQFVQMLRLLRDHLQARDIAYCYLDGSTINRAEVVQRFQSGAAPVFLISLKAGGVGLNLTAADTVIHFDPWWNPAVEDQAADRAHRIGQTRRVTAYKLIARGTVEEKVLQLQTRKREVINALLDDTPGTADTLTWEEIQELLG